MANRDGNQSEGEADTSRIIEDNKSSLESFLQAHNLDPVQLSVFAGVRYLTIWNAMKGKPIAADHAQKIRKAILLLTGRPYLREFTLLEEPSIDQQPTRPIRRLRLVKRSK
jgi:hypothetical protein